MEDIRERLSWFEILLGLALVSGLLLALLRPFRLINIGNITINRFRDSAGSEETSKPGPPVEDEHA